jgi:hypothetical protein
VPEGLVVMAAMGNGEPREEEEEEWSEQHELTKMHKNI